MQLTKINGKYELYLPDFRAARPEWKIENGGWEVQRIEAMLQVIKSTDVVFDIGTEEGDISALIAKYTGCDMVLVEPNDRVWPIIKAIWAANDLKPPLDFVPAFFSSKGQAGFGPAWESISGELIPDHGFKQLYENYPDVPQITLDGYINSRQIIPTVITMDVEGSEFEVLKGAEKILLERKPKIFMSVHPVFMNYHYKQDVGEMLRWIHERGYKHSVIELDYHELHLLLEPK